MSSSINVNFEMWDEAYNELGNLVNGDLVDTLETKVNEFRNVVADIPKNERNSSLISSLGIISTNLWNSFCNNSEIRNYYAQCKEVNKLISDMYYQEASIAKEEAEISEKSSGLKSFFATSAMVGLNVIEGAGNYLEDTVDGVATLLAAGCALIGWNKGKERIASFVEKEIVSDAFSNSYESGILKWVNDNSIYEYDSDAASVIKGVGYAATNIATDIAIGVVTGGSNKLLKLGLEVGVAATAGLGEGTSDALRDGKKFGESLLLGGINGVKEGTLNLFSEFSKAMDPFYKLTKFDKFRKATAPIFKALNPVLDVVDYSIQDHVENLNSETDIIDVSNE